MGLIKRWNGSSWVDYNDIRRFNGSNWNDKATVRRWNGSSWQVISEQKRTDVWTCSWTKSYNQDNMPQSGAKEGFPGRLYQGRYGNPDSYWYGNSWGRQRSMIGFSPSVTDTLKGARIEKIELYLQIQWAWYWAGAVATIGVHAASHQPDRFTQSLYGIREVRYNARSQGMWIDVTNVARYFSEGSIKGFTLLKESDDPLYYGYFHGYGSEAPPKIRVTYYK